MVADIAVCQFYPEPDIGVVRSVREGAKRIGATGTAANYIKFSVLTKKFG